MSWRCQARIWTAQLFWARLRWLPVEPLTRSSNPKIKTQSKSPAVKGLLLGRFPFEGDGEILSLSSVICEPAGPLRSFKFIHQSTDIELSLYPGLETLQSALNGEKNQRASCPAPSHCPRLPSLAGESACQFNHAAPPTGIFHSASPLDGGVYMCRHGLRRGPSVSFPALAT